MRVNLKLKSFVSRVCIQVLNPLASPLLMGTLIALVPPFLSRARAISAELSNSIALLNLSLS